MIATSLAGDCLSDYNYTQPLIPIWNAVMLFAMLGTSVTVLAAFRRAHLHLEETVAPRTAAGDFCPPAAERTP